MHRKSKYEQKKNIARSVIDVGIALCSCFVHILIIYANLKFPMGHGTLTKQFFIAHHMIFQLLNEKYEIETGKYKLIYAKCVF